MNTFTGTAQKRFSRLAYSGFAIIGALLLTPGAQASGPSNGPFVRQSVGFILRIKGPLTRANEAQLNRLGAYVTRNLPIIGSVAVVAPVRNAAKLCALPFVIHASQDVRVHKTDAYTVGASGASIAWNQYGASGKGVTVAIVDSGIRSDADLGGSGLGSRVVASTNFATDSLAPDDLCGHGTHVAGIAAGGGQLSTGAGFTRSYFGIAPQSEVVNVRVLDSQGGGSVSTVVAGIQWVLTHKLAYNIRVMNLSLGHVVGESYKTDPLCRAVEVAWKSGIVVVCSAGNDGRLNATSSAGADNSGYGTAYGTISSPANDPYVITVGAMKQTDSNRTHDTAASYSSRGPSRLDFVVKPDIVAPGNLIVSMLSNGSYLDSTYGSTAGVPYSQYMSNPLPGMSPYYFTMSGTSMAAPVVTGAAALMLQLQPNLSPDTVKTRLMAAADKWVAPNGQGDMFTYGAGYLDIPGALSSHLVATHSALSPTATRHSDGTVTLNLSQSLLNGVLGILFGLLSPSDIWGNRAMWGEDTVSPNRAMWGEGFWTNSQSYEVDQASAQNSNLLVNGDR